MLQHKFKGNGTFMYTWYRTSCDCVMQQMCSWSYDILLTSRCLLALRASTALNLGLIYRVPTVDIPVLNFPIDMDQLLFQSFS
jgi:hypothetical protein